MLIQTFKRILRKPVPALALLVFAAVMAAVLCGLQAANEAEQTAYEEAYRTVPVTVTVTDLTGTKSDDLKIEAFALNVFRSPHELGDYLKDLEIKMPVDIDGASIGEETITCSKLIGITSLCADSDLAQSADSIIAWLDGYDESVLRSDQFVCILPEKWMPESAGKAVTVSVVCFYEYDSSEHEKEQYKCQMTVVGTHNGRSSIIYCPFYVAETAYNHMPLSFKICNSLSATVADNTLLDELRAQAADWFQEPSPTGEKVPWGYSWYSYYPNALVIDDSQLVAAATAMEDSLRINNICTLAVFGLSAAASFFVGFLMVRGRRREIALMRTMGTPRRKIWFSFALEQMLCVLLGAALGGAVFLWHPVNRLGLFLAVYFAGLALALLIFLHSRLITAVKEEE